MDRACFWFYYPKARGCGLVIDSRALRRDGNRGNRAQVFRLDWHRCSPVLALAGHPGRSSPRLHATRGLC